MIARLGGYLARANDSPPGNMVIWRGLSRLTDIEMGFFIGAKLIYGSNKPGAIAVFKQAFDKSTNAIAKDHLNRAMNRVLMFCPNDPECKVASTAIAQ